MVSTATLLQSATVAVKYGLSGPLWYGASATIQLFIFATLSIQLKTKAPGAKTFLQVIRVRFGAPTHIVFCVFAALTNIIVMMFLLLSGSAVLKSLTIDLSIEMACVILAAVIGSYTLVGGLGATFYVSYFNVALVFCFLIIMVTELFLKPPSEDIDLPYGNPEIVYNYIQNITGPVENYDRSYLTIISSGGLMFAIITVVLAFSVIFGDQSYWQSSVAAKPIDGVWGFIAGGIVWFSIPFVLATAFGFSYLAIENWQGVPILTPLEVEQGLVVPAMAQVILGKTGEYVTFLFILMAIMSTGSAEVVALASLIVYDLYQPYIKPFRKHLKEGDCVVCGKPSIGATELDDDRSKCSCKPVVECSGCDKDIVLRKSDNNLGVHQPYTCTEHGLYKQYQDNLLNYKSWCILWITLFTIPLVLCSHWVGLNLGWLFLFVGIMIGCVVVPVILSITWSKTTSAGMISGVISGCLCGITLWLATASDYEGGLYNFLENTGREIPMLIGNCVSLGLSGIVCIIVSLCTLDRKLHNEDMVWEKLRNIENPLHPWAITYARDFGIVRRVDSKCLRPTQQAMRKLYRRSRITAIVVGISLTIGFLIVWPAVMVPIGVLNKTQFVHWTNFSIAYSFICAAFIIIVPLVQEIYLICRKVRQRRKMKFETDSKKKDEYENVGYVAENTNL